MSNLGPTEITGDYVVRATALDGQIRALVGQTKELVEEARQKHHTSPIATAALGRTLTAGLLLAQDLKGDNTLTIRVMGDGPLGGIIVTADAAGGVRGYVQEPEVYLPSREGKLDVGGAVGKNGTLHVSKDLGMKEPYVGSVPLVSGEIAEDLTYYLAASEQIPSVTALGVLVNTDGRVIAAGGFILQLMPGATESTISWLEGRLVNLEPVSTMLARGLSPADILREVLGESTEIKILGSQAVSFRCQCSREKLMTLLVSLGREELANIRQEEGQVEVRCHFCNEVYSFAGPQLEQLIEESSD